MNPVLVIGSSNTDMVVNVAELPRPGQTVLGDDFRTFDGGKGANQAVAARRAGAEVQFVAAVGVDDFGRDAVAMLDDEDIDTAKVQTLANVASGVALIFVSSAGENCIAVAPGANSQLSPEYLQDNAAVFDNASVVLLQLETPVDTVAKAVELAAAAGTPCILNPAPAAPVPDEVTRRLFCITPNESEAELLTGVSIASLSDAKKAADLLLQRGVQNVVITLGKDGALLCNGDGCSHFPAEDVKVVDTTAAGDTFNGVLAAMLAKGRPIHAAVQMAVYAATLSVQAAGAIASIPKLADQGDQFCTEC